MTEKEKTAPVVSVGADTEQSMLNYFCGWPLIAARSIWAHASVDTPDVFSRIS